MLFHRKNLFAAAAFFFLLQGCKKENDSSFTGYLRGKIDGVVFESSGVITANDPEQIPGGPSDPTIRINSSWPGYGIRLMIISESSSISTGIYPFAADKQRSGTLYIGSNAYYAGQTGGGFSGLPLSLAGSGSITFTEVSKHYVKGTFQFISRPDLGIIKTISDGEFYAKRE